jgi:23S rRNA (pseudouridine1915-N3)-methyltransferase
MWKIKIICLGKFKERAFVELEKEYLKRLSPFAKVKVVELPEVAYRRAEDVEKTKQKEAESIEKHISKD